MSAPEALRFTGGTAGVRLARCELDIVEVSAAEPGDVLAAEVATRGVPLPPFGRVARVPQELALSVRPGRSLVLSASTASGTVAGPWQPACQHATSVDLSSALSAFVLSGPAAREVLARGCRLDLDAPVFSCGSAAATIMAQVAVVLALLPAGMLLLSPSSTAQHFHEWLVGVATPFGLARLPGVTIEDICGDRSL